MGGDAGLLKWAKDNPSLFYERVWCKLLPREFKAEINTVDYAAILAAGRQRVLKARAIERRDIFACRPLDISSRSARVRAKRDLLRSGGRMPPVRARSG